VNGREAHVLLDVRGHGGHDHRDAHGRDFRSEYGDEDENGCAHVHGYEYDDERVHVFVHYHEHEDEYEHVRVDGCEYGYVHDCLP